MSNKFKPDKEIAQEIFFLKGLFFSAKIMQRLSGGLIHFIKMIQYRIIFRFI